MSISPTVKAIAQRMVRSAASAMLSVGIVGDGVMNAFDTDWQNLAGVGAGAAFVSLLISLAALGTNGNGPAIGNVEEVRPE